MEYILEHRSEPSRFDGPGEDWGEPAEDWRVQQIVADAGGVWVLWRRES